MYCYLAEVANMIKDSQKDAWLIGGEADSVGVVSGEISGARSKRDAGPRDEIRSHVQNPIAFLHATCPVWVANR